MGCGPTGVMMGVDCRWEHNAPLGDVANAIGILLGCKRTFEPEHGWVKVEGVKTGHCENQPELARITVTLPGRHVQGVNANGTGERAFLWHWESGPEAKRLIMPRATAANIALMRRLAQTFGGTFERHDCGDAPVERFDAPPDLHAEDGRGWYDRQARLAALRPLTAEDVEAAQADASY